jgi:hypothetical protein
LQKYESVLKKAKRGRKKVGEWGVIFVMGGGWLAIKRYNVMTLNAFVTEFRNWKCTKYKAIIFAVGISALHIYKFVGRPNRSDSNN